MPPQQLQEDELTRLRGEWRDRLVHDISRLNETCEQIWKEVSMIREHFAKSEQLKEVEKRVLKLEDGRSKLVGGFFAAQGAALLIFWLIHNFGVK